MARKYDELTKIYDETSKRLTGPSEWRHFLESACRNYRLRFDEQILVFAQRSDATAVLEIERWNKNFGRWVNRGASGIAVFEDADRNNQRLRYYFDISDTHESRLSRPVPIWNMREEYAEDVIDTLENTFGELENRSSLSEAILSAAQNAVEDNTPDYVGDLLLSVDNSFLYGLTEDTVRYMYNNLVTHSVAYMMMERLGVDTSLYYSDEDFKDVMNFSSVDAMNTLGFAASDISEMALSEISKTVLALDRENRTIANLQRSIYNNDTIQPERRNEHDRDNLHQTGRLQSARPDLTRTAAGRAGDLRSDEAEIPQTVSPSPVLQSPDQVQNDSASVRHRAGGAEDGGQPHQTDGAAAGRDGAAEGSGSTRLGEKDEQHPSGGERDRDERSDLRGITDNRQAQEEQSEPAFFDLSARELAERMLDYLTDYIVDYYEEQDGEPIELPDDGVDPVLLQRLEYDLFDVDTMDRMINFLSENYYQRDNDDEINAVYDKVIDALQHRINDPVMTNDKYVRGDVELEYFDRSNERRDLRFLSGDDDIKAILLSTPHLKASKSEIAAYFESVRDEKLQTEYIKSIFNNDYTEVIVPDGRRMGYKTYQNVLHFWEGETYNTRTAESYYGWSVVAAYFEGMRLLGELRDTEKPLLSAEGQLELISERAEEKSSAFVFSQELIDDVLVRKGSGFAEGKFRIYEQFQKSLSRDENIRFLKNEYGIGGSYPVLTGTGVDMEHDSKGIMLKRGFGDDKPHILLKWNTVERRISELIKMGRYLSDRELSIYPTWLQTQEQQRQEQEEQRRQREEERRRQMEMETALEERQPKPENYEYRFHLGDSIYIGSATYELLSIDDDRVMLFDPKFPLLNQEMPREEFEAKVKENPLNNRLRVVVESPAQPEEEKTVSAYPVYSADRYFELKAQNPESIFLFRVGDFYEIMGDDAVTASEALDLTLISRRRNDTERVPMVGFPAAAVETYMNMLLDRGMDVAIMNDNGEVLNVVSNRKERPVDSYPVGRIDYYKADGTLDTSIEYTNAAQLRRDVVNDSPTESMSLYLYRDKDGNAVSHSFIDDLPRPLRSFEIVDNPITGHSEYTVLLDRAKKLINEFCQKEYQHIADFDNLSKVNLAYTETEDGLHEIQSYANLEDFSIVTMVDGQVVRTEPYDSLQEMVDQGLQDMEFGDLVYVSEKKLAPFYDDINEEDVSAIRQHLAEAGIVNGKVVDPEKLDSDPFIQQVMADADAAAEKPDEEIKLRSVVIDLRPDDVVVAEHIGRTVRIDDRDFLIEDVSERGEVSMRDLTFERETGYPVFRREKAGLVRKAIAEQSQQNQQDSQNNVIVPAWERQPRAKVQTFDLHPDIPMADRHTFDLKAFTLEEVGKKARFRRNIEAIRLLKECEFDNRFATPEEQQVLAQYVGWGGIPEAFDENNAAWSDEFTELYGLLSPEEYDSARASTLTAFYTPPVVISAMYKVMENMGFQRGNILEPSCGIGNFIGMLPQSMSESRVFGVEIDTISAGIAQQLYQKSSIAAQPFEKAEIPDSFFDAVVGNVPFGDFGVSDKRYDKYHFMIHDYFFGATRS